MRVKLADLPNAVTQILLNVRKGVQDARNAGLIAELPEKVDFQVEVITDYQALQEKGTSKQTSDQKQTDSKPAITTTTTRSGGGQTTTDTQTTKQDEKSSGSTGEDSTTKRFY